MSLVISLFQDFNTRGETLKVIKPQLDAKGAKSYKVSSDGTLSVALMDDDGSHVLELLKEDPRVSVWTGNYFDVLPHWRQKTDAEGNPLDKTVLIPVPDLPEPQWVETFEDGELVSREKLLDENDEQVIIYRKQPDQQAVVKVMEWFDPDPSEEKRSIYFKCWNPNKEVRDSEGNLVATVYQPRFATRDAGESEKYFDPDYVWDCDKYPEAE